MDLTIRAEQLTKTFRQYRKDPGILGSIRSLYHRPYTVNHAVEDFSVSIDRGEIVGLLGPNGAGKTTLMKMFTGIISPSSGNVSVLGYEPFERSLQFRKSISLVMGQKSQLWWDIPALDSLHLLRRYYEVEENDFGQRLNELAELLEVQDLLRVHVRKLSLGERMKMELLACLLHRPQVLFLDEPTIGLDLVAQRNIRSFIREYHARHQTTIILTSHYMQDVASLCDRIVLVLKGKKRFDGSILQFEGILGREKVVTITFAESQNPANPFFEPFSPNWSQHGNQVELRIPENTLREVTAAILRDFPVADFATEKLPIERVMETLLHRPELL